MGIWDRKIVIGGLNYELIVRVGEPESGQFFGGYFCETCHNGQIKYNLRPTIEEAIEDGNRLAVTHHECTHRQAAEPEKN